MKLIIILIIFLNLFKLEQTTSSNRLNSTHFTSNNLKLSYFECVFSYALPVGKSVIGIIKDLIFRDVENYTSTEKRLSELLKGLKEDCF